ncbi:MAG: hypothetical protein HY001_04830 [Candidatus Portnoybacteria bacterium]|nr:hypothetical protein [Candidatus Portnoybacteria bacterium]
MANKKILPIKPSDGKLVSWNRIFPKSVFQLEKGSHAGIVADREGHPHLFVFNTAALLDVLSKIDEKLVDRLSSEEYHSKAVNPAGWLIDEIESKLPLSDEYIKSLNDALEEARNKGWIPFQKIERELQLR